MTTNLFESWMTTNLFESWLLIYQHNYKLSTHIVSDILFDNITV